MAGYIYPAAAAGSMAAHGFHDVLLAAFGKYTTYASYDKYEPESDQTAITTLSILQAMAEGTIDVDYLDKIWSSDQLFGAWIDSFTLTVGGGRKAIWEVSGGAVAHAQAKRSDTAQAGSVSTVVLSGNVDSRAYDRHATYSPRVKYVHTTPTHLDNTGAGYPVISAVDAANSITISGGPIACGGAGGQIMPWCPSESVPATNPLVGISGSLALDAVADMPITQMVFRVERTHEPETDQAFTEYVPDLFAGAERTISLELQCRSRHDLRKYQGTKKRFTSMAVAVDIGDTAARYAEVNAGQMELEVTGGVDVPERGQGTVNFRGRCLESAGDDEVDFRMY